MSREIRDNRWMAKHENKMSGNMSRMLKNAVTGELEEVANGENLPELQL